MNSTRKEFAALFANIPLFLVGTFLLAFPLVFSAQMTEAFMLPKHLLLAAIVTLSMISLGFHMVSEGKIRLRTTPFDIPVLLFTFVVIASAFLSVNKFQSLIAAVPFMYAALLFYTIVNSVKSEKALLFVLSCLIIGAAAASLLSVLGFFHIYPLPFQYAKSPYFSSVGNLLDQALYFGMVLPVAGYFALRFLSVLGNRSARSSNQPDNKSSSLSDLIFTLAFLVITAGLIVSLFYLVTSQKPFILPMGNGFQIAFAAISQDAGRMIKSFFFGSGYGTFLTDFTRFKQPSYNADSNLWAVTFVQSSSFILELLATTGLLGVLSFMFIIFRIIREKTIFLPLAIAIVAAFILPFSPLIVTFFFAILGIFSVVRAFSGSPSFEETELHLIAFEENVEQDNALRKAARRHRTVLLPSLFILLLFAVTGVTDYYTSRYAVSDITFQKSSVAASQNNGAQMYKLQTDAIQLFPYRDYYHQIFSQTNLQLANALAKQTPAGASPSAQIQQTVLTLIQQSINSGRSATSLSPYSALNWNNLSTIYRSLIGFGQNADQFAILSSQQAITLDASNPQQYVNLGGIYYQLGLWDEAIRQFQIAIQLKPDYTNAYYNAGHALEAKGSLQQALTVYNAVKTLVASNHDTTTKITAEIDALKNKINEQSKNVAGAATEAEQQQVAGEKNIPTQKKEDLSVNKPPTLLPTQVPQAKIEGVTITPLPTETKQTISPTPAQ
jgi:tetratricopeptide (TPR) repeat protein